MTPSPARAIVPLLRETGATELAALLRSPVWLGSGVPPGDSLPVLLLPGYGLADTAFLPLTRWLRLRGYRTYRSHLGLNMSCSELACRRLERRLEAIADARGERVAIVGHSRGGIIARALATARPDLVSGIITLGSPATVAPAGCRRPDVIAVGALAGGGHLPNLLSWRCVSGECGTRFREALGQGFPGDVGFVSVYSRSDIFSSWRLSRHPAATHVEVRTTHVGLVYNADVYREIGHALAGFAEPRDVDRSWVARVADQAKAAGRALAP